MDHFRQCVSEYVKLEYLIKDLNTKLKGLREQKSGLTEPIVKYMIENNIDSCNLPDDSRLVMKSQIQLGSINKDYMYDTLVDFYKQPQPSDAQKLAEKTTDTLLSNREVTEKNILKILKKK